MTEEQLRLRCLLHAVLDDEAEVRVGRNQLKELTGAKEGTGRPEWDALTTELCARQTDHNEGFVLTTGNKPITMPTPLARCGGC